jgi:hypothetical protein
MNNYLSDNQIKRIASICNNVYSKTNKTKLLEIGNKYNLVFDQTRQNNMNLLWFKVVETLKQDPKAIDPISRNHFAKWFKEAGAIGVQDMIFTYMKDNSIWEDYQFLCNFKPDNLLYDINEITRFAGLHYHYEVNELYNVDNYEKYFTKMYGIESANQKAVKATKRVSKFFDELLADIPNKAGVFTALTEYLQTNDLSELHNSIHGKLD